MITGRAIHEQDADRQEELASQLDELGRTLVSGRPPIPLVHTAHYDLWGIELETSSAGELHTASITRAGQETYQFVRSDGGYWQAVGREQLFEDAHFHNLVVMTVRKGLDWASSAGTV